MSDKNKIHIRDVMAGGILKDQVSNRAMCGDSGDDLTFGIYSFSNCHRCKKSFDDEKRLDKSRHWFRLKMMGLLNGGGRVD